MSAKLILPKNLGAMHISNDLTLVERKVMNVILLNALNIERSKHAKHKTFSKNSKTFYTINLLDIENTLGWEPYVRRPEIKQVFDKLISTSLKFNILKRQNTDNGKWNITSALLSDAITNNDNSVGEIHYAFSFGIKDIILKPALYGFIHLSEQKNINSKYTLALFEYLQGEVAVNNATEKNIEYITTGNITINDYKLLIGGSNSNYAEFKHINKELIKEPLKEINDKTSLTATAKFHKDGRKIAGISFNITKTYKQQTFDFDDSFSTEMPEDKGMIKVRELMAKHKIGEQTQLEFLKKYHPKHIEENIKYCIKNNNKKEGFIVTAIKKNYANYKQESEQVIPEKNTTKISKKTQQKTLNPEFLQHFQSILKNYFNSIHFPWIESLIITSHTKEEIVFAIEEAYIEIIRKNNDKFDQVCTREYTTYFHTEKPWKITAI
jgi:hypothetical protein